MQAALFLISIGIIIFLTPETTPQLAGWIIVYWAFMPIILAFFLGYVLRDIGNSVKALMLSQLFGWFLIVAVFAASFDEFRTFLVSYHPSREVGFAILLFTGLGVFAILLGIPASALGGFLGDLIERRRSVTHVGGAGVT